MVGIYAVRVMGTDPSVGRNHRGAVMRAFLRKHAMIRKILMIAIFTCLGLALAGVTFFATYENRYHEILRLKKESERIPEAERKAKAKEIAAKMFEKYQSTKYMSFKADYTDYWYKPGKLSSNLPMDWWPLRKALAHLIVAMTPESMKAETFVDGKLIHTLFLKDGQHSEFKWPWNGVPGMHTKYSFDPRWLRLGKGINPYVL